MQNEKLIEKLNAKLPIVRKLALNELKNRELSDPLLIPDKSLHEINLNVHTNFSFSPYTSTLAAYMAYKSGVKVACVCDYGTEYATEEFSNACKKLGISAFPGFEVTLSEEGRKEYLCAIYALNQSALSQFKGLLASFREVCVQRGARVCEKINKKLRKYDLQLNFDKDVLKFIKGRKGATLTLKHVYMAAGAKLEQKFGRGRKLAEFLRTTLCLDIKEGSYNLLCDAHNPFYEFDLISALRDNFDSVEGGITPPALSEYIEVAKKCGAVISYEYVAPDNWLKNQTESDKTLKDFEKLVDEVKEKGFNSVSISSLNLNEDMIVNFVNVLREKQMLAVFAEKTEYPRNHFASIAPSGAKEYLEQCAYAMLGNLISLEINENDGFFTSKSIEKCPSFEQRLALYAQIGRNKDNYER